MNSPEYELNSIQVIREVTIKLLIGSVGSYEPKFIDFQDTLEVEQGEFKSQSFHI